MTGSVYAAPHRPPLRATTLHLVPEKPASTSAPEPRVLHQTAGWFVLDKPAGWHVVAQKGGNPQSVEGWLREHHADLAALPECGLVHRLDAGTSGCLVVARSATHQTRLRAAFGGPGGEGAYKTYLAVARSGLPANGRFSLYFSSRHKGSAKISVHDRGDPNELGECTWQVMAAAREANHDVLRVQLIGAGRRHQIRAGLAYRGHPLLGDALYGGTAHERGAALHAWQVEVDGVGVESPPDARFARIGGVTPSSAPSLPSTLDG